MEGMNKMSDSKTYYNVPRFPTKENEISEDTLNAPIVYIQKALNALQTYQQDSCIVYKNLKLNSDVDKGDIVYYNTEVGCFCKALAALSGEKGIEGQTVQAPSSRVQGVIIDIGQDRSSNTLLKQGFYKDQNIIKDLIADEAKEAGIYYLSSKHAGKVQLEPGWTMRQPCISYYGSGLFSVITTYIAHDAHIHYSYSVGKGTASTVDPSMVCTKIEDIQAINALNSNSAVFFLDGKLDTENVKWDNDSKTLSWPAVTVEGANNTEQTAGRVVLFAHLPTAYGDAVVRSIKSDTLSINADSGNYKINTNFQLCSSDSITRSAWAICNIQGNTLKRTQIVSDIQSQCTQLIINKTENGVFTIDSTISGLSGTPVVKADQIKLNGAQRMSQDLFTYSVMPAGIRSSITASASIFASSSAHRKAGYYIVKKGTIPNNVKLQFYMLDLDNTSLSNNTPIAAITPASSNENIIQGIIKEDLEIPANCMLILNIIADKPSTDIYILNIGFRILPV